MSTNTLLKPPAAGGGYRMAPPEGPTEHAPRFKLIRGPVTIGYDPDEKPIGVARKSDQEIEVL